MIRFYSPILLLQLFCLYHAYTHRSEQKWYWLIVFFPLIGSLIYLYDTFASQQNLDDISEGVKETFISNYKIEQLEKQLEYSDTVANRIALADEYATVGAWARAAELYESCQGGVYADDVGLIKKIVLAHYRNRAYGDAVHYGNQILEDKQFQHSTERIAYAWALYHQHLEELAEENFRDMDHRFSNYEHRLEYARFLRLVAREGDSREKVEELLHEIESMGNAERRQKKRIHREIYDFYESVKG